MRARVLGSLSLTGLAALVLTSLLVIAAPASGLDFPRLDPITRHEPTTKTIDDASRALAPAVDESTAPAPTMETGREVHTNPAWASHETTSVGTSDAPIEASPSRVPLVAFPAGAARVGQTPDSGINGVVLLGPSCPRPTDLPVCKTPVGATLSVFRPASNEAVASVRVGPLGRFQIPLQPGPYVLRVVVSQAQEGPREVTRAVTVKPHEFTLEVIRFSSIRIR